MPNCFSLTRKGQTEPERLQVIDDILRVALLSQPRWRTWADQDTANWLNGWYNTIGFSLACGETFETLRQRYSEDLTKCDHSSATYYYMQLAIVDWLDTNYTIDAWAEIGR